MEVDGVAALGRDPLRCDANDTGGLVSGQMDRIRVTGTAARCEGTRHGDDAGPALRGSSDRARRTVAGSGEATGQHPCRPVRPPDPSGRGRRPDRRVDRVVRVRPRLPCRRRPHLPRPGCALADRDRDHRGGRRGRGRFPRPVRHPDRHAGPSDRSRAHDAQPRHHGGVRAEPRVPSQRRGWSGRMGSDRAVGGQPRRPRRVRVPRRQARLRLRHPGRRRGHPGSGIPHHHSTTTGTGTTPATRTTEDPDQH